MRGVRPGLFLVAGRPDVGLAAVEAGQVQLYKERWQALEAGPQAHPRSVRPRVPEDERGCCPLYEAAWMRTSVARAHPCERAAQRLGLVSGGAVQARVDDGVDAVAGYTESLGPAACLAGGGQGTLARCLCSGALGAPCPALAVFWLAAGTWGPALRGRHGELAGVGGGI